MLGSYDEESNEFSVEKSNKIEDTNPESNTFKHLVNKLDIPCLFPEEDEEDEEIETIQNKIEILNLSEEEFNEHFESKSITSFDFDSSSSSSSSSFHILAAKDEEDDDEEDGEEKDSTNKLITKLMIFNRSNRYDNPLIFMQYLAALLYALNLHSINVLHSNIIDFIKAISDSFEVDDEDDVDNGDIEMMEPFKNVSKIDTSSLETIMKDMQKHEQRQIRLGRSDLANKLIIYDAGAENTWYIVNNLLNNKTEEEKETDQVDNNVCGILLQIGGSLITTIAVLLLKNIKTYMKNHKSTSSPTETKTEEKEMKNHPKTSRNPQQNRRQWYNIVEKTCSRRISIIIEVGHYKKKKNIGEEDQTKKS